MVRARTLARVSWDQNGESGEVELETLTLALSLTFLNNEYMDSHRERINPIFLFFNFILFLNFTILC